MKNKYSSNDDSSYSSFRSDDKGSGGDSSGFHLSKADNDLFKEEDYIENPVARVKYSMTKKHGERWIFYQEDEIIGEIQAYRFKAVVRDFFKTRRGMQFLMECARKGFMKTASICAYLDESKIDVEKFL